VQCLAGNNGHLFATASGNQVALWDMRSDGAPMYCFSGLDKDIKGLKLDSQLGRMALVHGSAQIRIFRLNHDSADMMVKFTLPKIV